MPYTLSTDHIIDLHHEGGFRVQAVEPMDIEEGKTVTVRYHGIHVPVEGDEVDGVIEASLMDAADADDIAGLLRAGWADWTLETN